MILIKKVLFILVLVFITYSQYNSVRIVDIPEHVPGEDYTDTPTEFFDRVREAGYTHVKFGFGIPDEIQWTNGLYTGTAYRNFLTLVMRHIHNNGLRFIPALPSPNMHQKSHILDDNGHRISSWAHAENPDIYYQQINRIELQGYVAQDILDQMQDEGYPIIVKLNEILNMLPTTTSKLDKSVIPSYAENPNNTPGNLVGFDRTYNSLIQDLLLPAFEDFKTLIGDPNYELEFIHIGYDEVTEYDANVDRWNKLQIGTSQEDLKWLYENDDVPGRHYKIQRVPRQLMCDRCLADPGCPECLDCPECVEWCNEHADCVERAEEVHNFVNNGYTGAEFWTLKFFDDYQYGVDRGILPGDDPQNPSNFIQNMEIFHDGVCKLFADNVRRVVQYVKNSFPESEVIIYGDMLDPQHLGGYLGTSNTVEKLKDLTITVNGNVENITDHLILSPWQYSDNWLHDVDITGRLNAQIHLSSQTVFLMANIEFWSCIALTPKFLEWICALKFPKWIHQTIEGGAVTRIDVTDINFNSTGRKYYPTTTIDYFLNNNFRVIYHTALEYYTRMYSNTLAQQFQWTDAAESYSATQQQNILGYVAANYRFDDGLYWSGNDLYNQPPRFNLIELLPSELQIVNGNGTSAFFGNMSRIPGQTYLLDRNPVSKLDYFINTRNIFRPDCDIVNVPKNINILIGDAIYYCNKLSEREGLDPVYEYSSISFNDNQLNPDAHLQDYIVQDFENFNYNPAANGYRLPTFEEMQTAVNNGYTSDFRCELIWSPTGDPVATIRHYYDFDSNSEVMGNAGMSAAFRVLRSLPIDVTISDIEIINESNYWASNSILIQNTFINTSGSFTGTAGNFIRIIPEFHAKEGCYLHLKIDPSIGD